MTKFVFWCLSSHGAGISGGDRIYIEFAKRWGKRFPLTIVTWAEGVSMMDRFFLHTSKKIRFLQLKIPEIINRVFLASYIFRIIIGVIFSLFFKVEKPYKTYLYSASEFWMDTLPCFLLKIRYPTLTWVASWYQTAPSPIQGFSTGNRAQVYRLSAILLWLSQLPIKPIIGKYADMVLVNNAEETKVFKGKKSIIVLGAVDVESILAWQKKNPKTQVIYSAVFQGRFHPQKGVVELIDIWKRVVEKIPNAKLAMIGDGPLMKAVKEKIIDLNLQENVRLYGFVFEGPSKYKIFASSLLTVHPAFFDSGGMASAEAMAFGLPVVGFDLPSYKSYYPKGMQKVPIGNLDAFANEIIDLVRHNEKRILLGSRAKEYVNSNYSWDKRAQGILTQIT